MKDVLDEFVITSRTLDLGTGVAKFYFELGDDTFVEHIEFGRPEVDDLDHDAIERSLDLLHVLAGTSYYKLRAPSNVRVNYSLTDEQFKVAHSAYCDGLGEFAAVNKLQLPHQVNWKVGLRPCPERPIPDRNSRALLPIGGGKDSALALSAIPGGTALAINPTPVQRRVATAARAPLLTVRRVLDPLLAHRTAQGGLNGHVPVTAINSAISIIAALLSGFNDVVFSNERSADESTTIINGVHVNHQYSKSYQFEQKFAITAAMVGIRYFSLTRQLSELGTVAAVSNLENLRDVLISCNRAFTLASHELGADDFAAQRWCLRCAKCCFTFLCFAVFLSPEEAGRMFGGIPLSDPSMTQSFRELWSDSKPWDCVGERRESAIAMTLLGRDPAWSEFPVVRNLSQEAQAYATLSDHDLSLLLTPRGPHAIPERYLSSLRPLLARARDPYTARSHELGQ